MSPAKVLSAMAFASGTLLVPPAVGLPFSSWFEVQETIRPCIDRGRVTAVAAKEGGLRYVALSPSQTCVEFPLDPPPEPRAVTVLRLGSAGQVLWERTFRGAEVSQSDYQVPRVTDAVVLGDGGVAVVGFLQVQVSVGAERVAFATRFSRSGQMRWIRGYRTGIALQPLQLDAVAADPLDRLFVVGSRAPGANEGSALVVMLLNPEGEILRAQGFSSAVRTVRAAGTRVRLLGDDGAVVAFGTGVAGTGIYHNYLMRLNGSLDIQWQREFSGTGLPSNGPAGLASLADGAIALSARANSNLGDAVALYVVASDGSVLQRRAAFRTLGPADGGPFRVTSAGFDILVGNSAGGAVVSLNQQLEQVSSIGLPFGAGVRYLSPIVDDAASMEGWVLGGVSRQSLGSGRFGAGVVSLGYNLELPFGCVAFAPVVIANAIDTAVMGAGVLAPIGVSITSSVPAIRSFAPLMQPGVSNCAVPTAPRVRFLQEEIEVGAVPAGQCGTAIAEVENFGTQPATLQAPAIAGSPTFAIQSQSCTTAALAPGARCSVHVSYCPDDGIDDQASVVTQSNDPVQSQARAELLGVAPIGIYADGFEPR